MPEGVERALERLIVSLRKTEPANPHAVSRIVRAVGGERGASRKPAGWLERRRTLSVRAIVGLAVAASAAGLVLGGVLDFARRANPATTVAAAPTGSGPLQLPIVLQEVSGGHAEERPMLMQFVLVAPDARSVALVGDFNGWDPRAEPLRRDASGIWSGTVTLMPGRHAYAFILDDSVWTPDPRAPFTEDADFGRPNSVVVVGGI